MKAEIILNSVLAPEANECNILVYKLNGDSIQTVLNSLGSDESDFDYINYNKLHDELTLIFKA